MWPATVASPLLDGRPHDGVPRAERHPALDVDDGAGLGADRLLRRAPPEHARPERRDPPVHELRVRRRRHERRVERDHLGPRRPDRQQPDRPARGYGEREVALAPAAHVPPPPDGLAGPVEPDGEHVDVAVRDAEGVAEPARGQVGEQERGGERGGLHRSSGGGADARGQASRW